MNKRAWTGEEDDYIKNSFGTVTFAEMARSLDCSISTVQARAEELGLPVERKTVERWSKEEEALLLEYSKKYVAKTIARKLGRSYLAVQKKALKLGIELHFERDPWKKWMINYLKDNINVKPIGEIQTMLGLSYRRILTKCKELGIEYVSEKWTEEEISILKEYAQKCHYSELVKVLPNRSVGAITAKAYELNIVTISQYTKLDQEKIEFIKKNWGKLPATEIARKLKISTGIVYRYKKELNLPNVGQRKKWTKAVIEKLRKDAKKMTRNELAKKYKTSPGQISNVASKNGILLIDSKKVWTKKLDKELLELSKQGLSVKEISISMSIKASLVRSRLKQLGVRANNPRRWSVQDVEKLLSLSVDKTISEIAVILNKTENQVYNKAKKLGIVLVSDKKHSWTEEETKLLKKIHNKYDVHIVAQVMERSEETVKSKAKELGLSIKFKERCFWTRDEEKKLEEYAKECTVNEISCLLNRSVASVGAKLRYMGLDAQISSKFWTEEEVAELTLLAQDYEIEEIVVRMNKSYGAVFSKLQALGIKAKNRFNRPWTEEESNLLLELLTTYSSFEVAQILDRSEEAVMVRAIKLGYDIDYTHRRWTKEDEVLLEELWGSKSIEAIARKLNRTVSAVINRSYALGLGSQISNNYDGLTIQDISDMFLIQRNTILTTWVSLGLKLSFRRRSANSIYSFVDISDLYDFLGKNQNIWDAKLLEKNILGIEPDWLPEKRRRDWSRDSDGIFKIGTINKQQLLQTKKYFLDLQDQSEDLSNVEDTARQKKIGSIYKS